MEYAPQESGHDSELARGQEISGQCSQLHALIFGGPVWSQELNSAILLGPFQLDIFNDSLILLSTLCA